MKALNCPNCGGTVKIVDKTSAYANCPYCGSKVYFKDKDVLNLVSSMRIVEDKLDNKNKDSIKDEKWNFKKRIFILINSILAFISFHIMIPALEENNLYTSAIHVRIGSGSILLIASFLILPIVFSIYLSKTKSNKKISSRILTWILFMVFALVSSMISVLIMMILKTG